MKHTRQETADAWIRMTKAGSGSQVYEDNFWAFEALYDLVSKDPEEAWPMILQILRLDQSPSVMENLSAGPLEDLLAKHGPAIIDRVEAEAARDRAFATLLGGVWQNRMTDEVWARVQAIRDRRGWDGIPE
jgi:Family of unknown function (DUF6869)